MSRCASLGMYDPPWLHEANDALWAAVRDALRRGGMDGVPDALDRSRPLHAILNDSGLLLAQTCGYPLMTTFAGMLRLVATPAYAFPGCDGPLYRSVVVVRTDDAAATLADLRGRRCAINGRDSNSGMNVLRALVAPLAAEGRFFGDVIETGAHLESLRAVREGRADVAAIDCVTHGLAARHRPALLEGTRVLTWTAATPGLPFVTADGADEARAAFLRAALEAALQAGHGAPIGLTGLRRLEMADYEPVMVLEREAAASGYPALG